jgi:hypothetical protein
MSTPYALPPRLHLDFSLHRAHGQELGESLRTVHCNDPVELRRRALLNSSENKFFFWIIPPHTLFCTSFSVPGKDDAVYNREKWYLAVIAE